MKARAAPRHRRQGSASSRPTWTRSAQRPARQRITPRAATGPWTVKSSARTAYAQPRSRHPWAWRAARPRRARLRRRSPPRRARRAPLACSALCSGRLLEERRIHAGLLGCLSCAAAVGVPARPLPLDVWARRAGLPPTSRTPAPVIPGAGGVLRRGGSGPGPPPTAF
ncbi:hypothetical protein ACRAWF_13155 [Streptomyces sp. L7]